MEIVVTTAIARSAAAERMRLHRRNGSKAIFRDRHHIRPPNS
jgi:hypothetical protein